ncbi:MAG: intracellular septation protein [Phenylobacterium zucineum]|nr:MAG: intracellular septation protein [Phenylobacterium zucineum]
MKTFAYAVRPLLNDLFSTFLFAGLIIAGVDPLAATVIAMLVGVAQLAAQLLARKPIAPLQWASLGLVVLFGGASLIFHDPRFLMAKPSVVYAIIAAFMLKRGWMLRYMPPVATGYGEHLMIAYGYVWAGLMVVSGVLNLIVAIAFPASWAMYKAIFPLASKGALFLVQYVHVHMVVKPKVIAAEQAAKEAQALAARQPALAAAE